MWDLLGKRTPASTLIASLPSLPTLRFIYMFNSFWTLNEARRQGEIIKC